MIASSVKQAKDRNDVVFLGEAKSCDVIDGTSLLTFSVKKIWKGEKVNEVYFPIKCSNRFFKIGKPYLVYANYIPEKDKSFIDMTVGGGTCSRTTELVSRFSRNLEEFKLMMNLGEYRYALSALFDDFDEIKELGSPIYSIE